MINVDYEKIVSKWIPILYEQKMINRNKMKNNLDILMHHKIVNKSHILHLKKLLRNRKSKDVLCYCYMEISKLNIKHKVSILVDNFTTKKINTEYD